MAGVKGRSGRRSLSLEELQLRGTFQHTRHQALMRPNPLKSDPKKLLAQWKRFKTRLETARAESEDWNPLDAYARSVVAGDVPAGKYHRLSCERHLRDRAHEAST